MTRKINICTFLQNMLNHTKIHEKTDEIRPIIITNPIKNCKQEKNVVHSYKYTKPSQNTVQKCKKQ